MPINEFRNPASNLSGQEQKDAMASLYGNPQAHQPQGNVNVSLTPEQYRVLQMVQAQAGNLMDQPVREFDLNKPPVEPYRYQEFPQMMYHHETRRTYTARNQSERQAMQEEGWRTEPFPAEMIEVPFDMAEDPAGEALNKLTKPKRRP